MPCSWLACLLERKSTTGTHRKSRGSKSIWCLRNKLLGEEMAGRRGESHDDDHDHDHDGDDDGDDDADDDAHDRKLKGLYQYLARCLGLNLACTWDSRCRGIDMRKNELS